MQSSGQGPLVAAVLSNSASDVWRTAVREWVVSSVEDRGTADGECVCGKVGLRYLYTISNSQTGRVLHPIGSECIQLFDNEEMDNTTEFLRRLLLLGTLAQSPWHDRTFAEAKERGILSRKFIEQLYDHDFFEANKFNYGRPDRDFHFYLDMFNAYSRGGLSVRQEKKADVLTRNLCAQAQQYLA